MAKQIAKEMPQKITPGSEKWQDHYQRMEELAIEGALLIRNDADMGIYNGTWGYKTAQPIGEYMEIETIDQKQWQCHLSDLEVPVEGSLNSEFVETDPGTHILSTSLSIYR